MISTRDMIFVAVAVAWVVAMALIANSIWG